MNLSYKFELDKKDREAVRQLRQLELSVQLSI